jgi:hypothetical protein
MARRKYDKQFEKYGAAEIRGAVEVRGRFDLDGARLSVMADSVPELW